jgi:hypothetical protein
MVLFEWYCFNYMVFYIGDTWGIHCSNDRSHRRQRSFSSKRGRGINLWFKFRQSMSGKQDAGVDFNDAWSCILLQSVLNSLAYLVKVLSALNSDL